MTLAVQLRNSSTQWEAYQRRQAQEAFVDDVKNARRIAEKMIASELPAFLAERAHAGRSRAYIVGLNAYKPRQWSTSLPRGTSLPLELCCKELVGVPLHLARWAIAQGMTIFLLGYHNFSKKECFAWEGHHLTDQTEGTVGICVYW